ncbi:hypothetical protein DUI87_01820 [Hirundo rustica rustica]|uniref:Uncharacterized protein n=1 Tax=Hirundo rustica rustica TaxID=333673 RepID=A0A3M0L7L8_HIRRU|nr:hypothetical protein DUI87_01820 [Hirundo rustica rustica]
MAMNQMNHLNTIANMAAVAQMHSPLSRAGASVIKGIEMPNVQPDRTGDTLFFSWAVVVAQAQEARCLQQQLFAVA